MNLLGSCWYHTIDFRNYLLIWKSNLLLNPPKIWYWIWTDIDISDEIFLNSWETKYVKIKISKENLPNYFEFFPDAKFNQTIYLWILWSLKHSTRSCFAQSWINVLPNVLNMLDFDSLKDILDWKEIELDVLISNLWWSDIKIKNWTWLFRFYYTNPIKKLNWQTVYNKIIGWEILIDWVYWYQRYLLDYNWNKLDKENVSKWFTLVIQLTDKKYIHNWWIFEVSTKRDLIRVLSETQTIDNNKILIWETPKVKLPKWLIFEIMTYWFEKWAFHIHSPLIDPLFEWPIRTEILDFAKSWLSIIDIHCFEI